MTPPVPGAAIAARFASAQTLADAVLYEGYLLYPYRASALKNRWRWPFGVAAPLGYAEAGRTEPSHLEATCLVAPGPSAALTVKIRFLHLVRRTIDRPAAEPPGAWEACDRIEVDGRTLFPWEEGVARDALFPGIPLTGPEWRRAFDVGGDREVEEVRSRNGPLAARIVRACEPLHAALYVTARPMGARLRVTVRVENTADWPRGVSDRAAALRRSLLGCHILLGIDDGSFLSVQDPPQDAVGSIPPWSPGALWPVLIGPAGSTDVLLAAPIALGDYPEIAPESPGDFFDGTEIDELLALRVLTMSDHEKDEAAATDSRAANLLARVHGSPVPMLGRLHGAARPPDRSPSSSDPPPSWQMLLQPPGERPPEETSVTIQGRAVGRGCRVRLAPSARSDTLDVFLRGRPATVRAVFRDLENRPYVAVTIDDDPGTDLRAAHGRFFYFTPDEIVPLDTEAPADAGR